jgi:drug/metabolite transporter (DMT)-like permease
MAVGLLGITHTILLGSPLPTASSEQWFWIGLSGIVGLGMGDFGLFAAFVMIGPRRSVLMMALSPVFASIGAFLLLGEIISPTAIIGIVLTLAGIVWVIAEREEQSKEQVTSNRLKAWGLLLALIGAIGQGIGLVLAKKGILLEPDVITNPLSATLMRMLLGAVFVWIIALSAGKISRLRKALDSKGGIAFTATGAVLGPFLGVTLSMVAVTYTQAGIAQTLMSLMPIFIIPVVWLIYKQKTSWRGILGAIVAVIGVTILFLI